MQKPLELEKGKQIIDSIDRLAQLQSMKDKTPNDTAEANGLVEFLKNALFEHAASLMGCWYAVRTEYEPLCNAFAHIASRADSINRQKAAIERKVRGQVEEAAAPVITEGELPPADPMAPVAGESNLIAPEGAPMILTPQFRKGKK